MTDQLEDYLPEFKNPQVYRTTDNGEIYIEPAKSSIKVKDLFTMSSGLTYEGDGNETERQVKQALKTLPNDKAMKGYSYRLGVRVLTNPALAGSNSSIGEFGWSGLAGTWVAIDPKENLSAVYMQQMFPVQFETYSQPRLRNIIFGAL